MEYWMASEWVVFFQMFLQLFIFVMKLGSYLFIYFFSVSLYFFFFSNCLFFSFSLFFLHILLYLFLFFQGLLVFTIVILFCKIKRQEAESGSHILYWIFWIFSALIIILMWLACPGNGQLTLFLHREHLKTDTAIAKGALNKKMKLTGTAYS